MNTCPNELRKLLRGIVSMTMDRVTSTATIVTYDGKSTVFPLGVPLERNSTIVRLTYLPSINQLHFETNYGDSVVAELPTRGSPAPIGGRPVIYLDQKDWSLLANVLHWPEKVRSIGEREAAERLITLAREAKVILPMSLGHMVETSKWTNTERRYRLALTVVSLSRGWQMRHPLDIRQYELQQSIATRIKQVPLPLVDVFTLDGCAAQHESSSRQHYGIEAGLPLAMAYAVDAWTCISSYFDVMLDSASVPEDPVPGRGWSGENQMFTKWLAGDSGTSLEKRKWVEAHFFSDLGLEIVQAVDQSGISHADATRWLQAYAGQGVRVMASLSLFKEIYESKHLNGQTVWRSNDLTDMMYLTCGAGYADYIVGERSLASHVRQAAARLHRSINIYPRVDELMVALEAVGH